MRAVFETTIGPVLAELNGHYIEIYTAEDCYREGLINLWDYQKREMTIEPGLRDFIRLVCEELKEYFEDFAISGLIDVEASDEELKL